MESNENVADPECPTPLGLGVVSRDPAEQAMGRTACTLAAWDGTSPNCLAIAGFWFD